MLKLSLIEFFLRCIPEGFILALSIYAFSSRQIDNKKLIISGIILSLNPYIVRIFPINFGVHTILLIMLYILVAVNINRIEIIKAIKAGLIAYMILSIADLANFFIVVNVLKIPVENLIDNTLLKMLLGLPSLTLFFVIVFLLYKKSSKKLR